MPPLPLGANLYPDLCVPSCLRARIVGGELTCLYSPNARGWKKSFQPARNSICDSVVVGLVLARTYCEMARFANPLVKRHHLFTLACEALTKAEVFVAAAPPEHLCSVLEEAQRLRLEIRQLNADARPD